MLHLAQVQNHGLSGKTELRLLARQEDEYMWAVMTEEVVVSAVEESTLSEGLLVLVELSPRGVVLSIQEATSWVLELLQTYLTSGITPAFLQQETERAEQWRQSLTLQNQELARRSLELEARREQIEALEENLKRDSEGNDREELKATEKDKEEPDANSENEEDLKRDLSDREEARLTEKDKEEPN
jgi:hypothetical protein